MRSPAVHFTTLSPAIRQMLEAIAGVERLLVHDGRVWLVCSEQSNAVSAKRQARALLLEAGLEPDGLEVTHRIGETERERVRFEGVERDECADMQAVLRVHLEWRGRRVTGQAVGERGINIEVRTAALAAIAALDAVSDGGMGVRLAGVKQVRAFDADLIVVSLYRPSPEFQKFLGVVLVGTDPRRAAALAVLHALNRVLGNYLSTR